MVEIAIITDSSADIPHELAEKNEITIVPMYLSFGGKSYREGMDIKVGQVYEALESGLKVTTSAPPAGDFIKVFKDLFENKKKELIYYIGLSSKLSGILNSAHLASKNFNKDKIKIFDSKTSTISLGLIVLEAAKAIRKGIGLDKLNEVIQELIINSRFSATLESMEHVFKGGRAVFLAKFLSSSFVFKPILTIGKDGKVKLKKFARNKKTAILELINQARKELISLREKCFKKCSLGIFYGSDKKLALQIEDALRQDSELKEIIDDVIVTEITAIISAHTGPGIWGVATTPKLEY
ncbi:MAG: DegV family protein [Actinobacteria bacterium]|nr:DegV family protein [Actinomycetota bacterium]